jgi:pimeloyl-ACP methyl ester carboxylesterase
LKNLRTYGRAPFNVAVVHGGPGAGGEMAPVARALAAGRGILEPIQTATSLEGQVQELKGVLHVHGDLPITLIGFSWGAWLSFIVAARYPGMVRKLILVASGPFEERYVARLHATRMQRLDEAERAEFEATLRRLGDPTTEDKDALLERLGALASKSDAYDPISDEADAADHVGLRGDLFQSVWEQAAEMRRSGRLLALGRQLQCPVVAIHGDFDPHPAEGVRQPLSAVVPRFRFILLEKCGHRPWMERQARDPFYRALEAELEE